MTNNNQKLIAAALAVAPFLLFADAPAIHEHAGEIAVVKAQTVQAKPTKPARSTPFIEYHNRMAVFFPLHQAYERIKPNDLYVGVEAFFTLIFGTKHIGYVAEGEFRMGYNFFWNNRDHFRPIAGIGALSTEDTGRRHHGHRHDWKPGILYGTLGFLYDHEFNSVVNLGVNLKGIIGGTPHKRRHRRGWGSGAVGGFDVAVPLTFRFGRNRHWDFRIEPFNLFLAGSKVVHDVFGFRNTIGYRF